LGRRNRRPAYGFTTEKRSDFDGGSLGWSRYNFCREFDFSKELLSEINLTGEQRKEYVEVKDGVGRWSFENWKKNKNSTLLN